MGSFCRWRYWESGAHWVAYLSRTIYLQHITTKISEVWHQVEAQYHCTLSLVDVA
jgi:hypothetical protein